jgi:hypothetical protein
VVLKGERDNRGRWTATREIGLELVLLKGCGSLQGQPSRADTTYESRSEPSMQQSLLRCKLSCGHALFDICITDVGPRLGTNPDLGHGQSEVRVQTRILGCYDNCQRAEAEPG